MKIIPTILTDSVVEFLRLNKLYAEISDEVHIDFTDSTFTENSTLDLEFMLENLEPFTTVTIHLMTIYPDTYIQRAIDTIPNANIKFLVHQEYLTEKIQKKFAQQNIVPVISADTILYSTSYYSKFAEIVSLNVKPGFIGGEFNEQSLSKIATIKDFVGIIGTDGGVNITNTKKLKKYKIQNFYAGSYLSSSQSKDELIGRVEQLKEKLID